MNQTSKKNVGCIIIIVAFILTVMIFLLNQVGIFGSLNFTSTDISLSKTYLCLRKGEECSLLENNTFFGGEFSQTKVCTEYSSSQPSTLSVFLYPKDDFPAFGMLLDRIGATGTFEICYLLTDIVESMDNSNIGGRFPSPVSNGELEPGLYQVVFEQGREKLEIFDFEVLLSE